MNEYAGYTIKWVTLPWEREQAYALRRQVFCREQELFADDDRDEIDDHAHLLVALGCVAGWHDRVVGTVRIHQQSPGVWLGSRLAVDAAYRRQGQLGPMLIRLAVCSAHALGCEAFYAQVQHQNEPLFRRMRWQTLDWLELRGVRHARMQADLAFYPPCDDPRSGMVIPASRPPRTADAAAFLTGERV
ncbi:MSMEG_0567/Sll0786 family nitrogen starvation N-acetyltransferase [Pantoea anthophila]|uniref:MSMEG_0567/Sll0786 family nitrogen starvation N-acetyltransferase n=1 Tax=Pantoea anthophila TaxID=470931 RepID=UPI002786870E|nr:MSMEG_0567/Sll0786 family nitrogen starvation N-acetyltransferase [Pantoea anthophila]MDQ1214998.1 putative N-acetyltransferase (TIGR04045 family) [Pantoea anthophila]